jgi:hypothetical protein
MPSIFQKPLKDSGIMAAFAVAKLNIVAFGHGIGWLAYGLVVAVATTASASLEILGVVQLIFGAVAFPYIPDKRVTTP